MDNKTFYKVALLANAANDYDNESFGNGLDKDGSDFVARELARCPQLFAYQAQAESMTTQKCLEAYTAANRDEFVATFDPADYALRSEEEIDAEFAEHHKEWDKMVYQLRNEKNKTL